MKKFTPVVLLLIFCINALAQPSVERRLRKSAKFNRAAWILVGTGTAATIGGIVLINDANRTSNYTNDRGDAQILETFGGLGLCAIGVAAISTSIPFFIKSHKLYKSTLGFSLKNENAPIFANGGFGRKSFPAMTVQIRF
jgi:hypothetical protein